jgi:hypothetical protein
MTTLSITWSMRPFPVWNTHTVKVSPVEFLNFAGGSMTVIILMEEDSKRWQTSAFADRVALLLSCYTLYIEALQTRWPATVCWWCHVINCKNSCTKRLWRSKPFLPSDGSVKTVSLRIQRMIRCSYELRVNQSTDKWGNIDKTLSFIVSFCWRLNSSQCRSNDWCFAGGQTSAWYAVHVVVLNFAWSQQENRYDWCVNEHSAQNNYPTWHRYKHRRWDN